MSLTTSRDKLNRQPFSFENVVSLASWRQRISEGNQADNKAYRSNEGTSYQGITL